MVKEGRMISNLEKQKRKLEEKIFDLEHLERLSRAEYVYIQKKLSKREAELLKQIHLPIEEIAQKMGVSKSTVYVMRHGLKSKYTLEELKVKKEKGSS